MYSLKRKKPLTFNDLLEIHREEAIYLYYLGDQFCVNVLIRSPFPDRDDGTPSFKLKYKDNMLQWHDFGDHKHGYPKSVVGFVMRWFGIEFYMDAIDKIVKDMEGFVMTPGMIKQVDIIREKGRKETKAGAMLRKEFLDFEVDFWSKIVVDKQLLEEYDVFASKEAYIDNKLWRKSSKFDPLFVYLLNKDSKDDYAMQFYRPLAETKANKFRDHNTDGKIFGLKQLPSNGETLIITKSCKDVLVLRSMGFWAICPFGEASYTYLINILPDLINRFNNVFIMYDPDTTGIEYSTLIASKFEGAVTNILIPDSFEKDPADNVLKGKRKEFIEFLINQTRSD